MLDETSVKRFYRLQYTNKKGEDLEVEIETGSSFFPFPDEWEEITLIKVRRQGQDDLEIEPDRTKRRQDDKFADYEEEAMDQFHKELKRSEEVMRSENNTK